MKWNHRGHQFDYYKQIFANKDVYVYGFGNRGKELHRLLGDDIKMFFDMKASEISWERVRSPFELENVNKEKSILILALSEESVPCVLKTLLLKGWLLGIQLFTYLEFVECFLPYYMLYRNNKLWLSNFIISINKDCSLKCRECSMQIPYLKKYENESLSQLTKSIDKMFEKIDFINELSVMGGEPLLSKYLEDILVFLCEKYRKRWGELRVITNCTVVPTSSLLKVMKDNQIVIGAEKYCVDTSKYELIVSLCERERIRFKSYNTNGDEWIKIWPDEIQNIEGHDKTVFFDFCQAAKGCEGLVDGKIVKCFPGYFAYLNNSEYGDADIGIDVSSEITKAELLEYLNGYTASGNIGPCKKCNGLASVNFQKIPVAEQIVSKG